LISQFFHCKCLYIISFFPNILPLYQHLRSPNTSPYLFNVASQVPVILDSLPGHVFAEEPLHGPLTHFPVPTPALGRHSTTRRALVLVLKVKWERMSEALLLFSSKWFYCWINKAFWAFSYIYICKLIKLLVCFQMFVNRLLSISLKKIYIFQTCF